MQHNIYRKEMNYLLVNIKIIFKNMNNEMFRKTPTAYTRSQLEYVSQIWASHLKESIDLKKKAQWRATKTVPEIRELRYG